MQITLTLAPSILLARHTTLALPARTLFPTMNILLFLLLLFQPFLPGVASFAILPFQLSSHSPTALFGRAAAVRAKTKSRTDAATAANYGHWGKKIILAVKSGGSPNPENNPTLKDAIIQAKRSNVPAANIERSINKGSGSKAGDDYREALYEASLPSGGRAACMISVFTDNSNRAAAEVKSAINKGGGKFGELGSVAYGFDKLGVLEYGKPPLEEGKPAKKGKLLGGGVNSGGAERLTEDEVLEVAVDLSVETCDVETIKQEYAGDLGSLKKKTLLSVLVNPKDMTKVMNGIGEKTKHFPVTSEIRWVPNAMVEVGLEEWDANMKLVDSLLKLEDVEEVYHNCVLEEEEDKMDLRVEVS